MILSDTEILAAIELGEIVIDPFDMSQLGGNSYDVRLAPVLRVCVTRAVIAAASSWGLQAGKEIHQLTVNADWRYCEAVRDAIGKYPDGMLHELSDLDCAVEPKTIDVQIPESGLLLVPGILYLASTVEYTETHRHVPYLDGRSSTGRNGISIHMTAGRGDVGFCNHWTMEIYVVQPVRVYAGMKIGQLTYHTVQGVVVQTYAKKAGTTYGKLARDPLPQPSRLWTQFKTKP